MTEFDLEFLHVTKSFGEVHAVDDVTFQVRRGEFLSLLGPSGCGKTTSLRMVAGFEQPTHGEIRLNGRPVGGVPPYQRKVNTVFQHYGLFPHMNVFDNVAFGLRMKRVPPPRIAEGVERMLALVELPHVANRFPHQLSGGQQQRIALARALINEPTVLLLDEPLGALDLKVRRRMQEELKRIHREVGVTFIYVTHDQEEALTMSDRIAVMNHGRIEQLDTPTAIYERPSTRFVASFIGMTNAWQGLADGHDANGSVVVRTAAGVFLRGLPIATIAVGEDVEVTVRPEKILLSTESPANAENCLQGRVVDIVYQGAYTEYHVGLPSGLTVRVVAQNQTEVCAPSFFPVDTPVFIHWTSRVTLVMPNERASSSVPHDRRRMTNGDAGEAT